MFDQPYTFSDPLTCALTLDKPLAKRLVRDHGLPTAPFAVVETEEDIDQIAQIDLAPPFFVKPAAEGSSKGITDRSRVETRQDLRHVCAELLRSSGLRVIERNWRCRHGEIDLIAEEGRTLVFVEVRMRSRASFGGAAESVTEAKRAKRDPREASIDILLPALPFRPTRALLRQHRLRSRPSDRRRNAELPTGSPKVLPT